MGRTEKGLTRQLVVKLREEFMVSLWRIAFKHCHVSYQCVKAWKDSKYEASPEHLAILQDLNNEQCKIHAVGLYSPIRTYPHGSL